MIEGDDNSEFELTSAGREVVARALESVAPATLATVKHGGCVQLPTSERERFEAYRGGDLERDAQGYYVNAPTAQDWAMWQAALSAQPSPGGQGDARLLADVDERIATAKALGYENDIGVGIGLLQCVRAALAARQPVGCGACGDGCDVRGSCRHAEENPPTQAVDLPYPLDADPAGIRAHVADVITGTLMVGAQGHMPPPTGHWAEPFWQAARADARVQEKTQAALQAAAKSLRTIANSTKDTEFLETASEIRAYANSRANCAEQALTDSQAVGNG
ncbi:hypothetical protein ACQ5SA_00310 [Stenotrophomonas indicatrix]